MSPKILSGLDIFNSAFEIALMVPFAFGLRTLYRVKDSRALNGPEQWPYMLHCLYTVFFFGVLGRWWSSAALLGWSIAFVIKILMIRHYRAPVLVDRVQVAPDNLQPRASVGQTRAGSIAETLTNVAIGYVVSLASQLVIFPQFGIHVPLQSNIAIGAWFTVVSIIRSYVLRRWFNRGIVRRS